MNKPIVKFAADFGPLFIFFIIYFNNENDLKLAIPPFIIATLISLMVIYFLEKRIPMVPLISGVLITFFGGLTLYFDNKIFFYMKPTIINLLFAAVLFFGKYFTQKPLLKIFFQNAFNPFFMCHDQLTFCLLPTHQDCKLIFFTSNRTITTIFSTN